MPHPAPFSAGHQQNQASRGVATLTRRAIVRASGLGAPAASRPLARQVRIRAAVSRAGDLTSREAVLRAIAEYDELGRDAFL